MEEMALLAVMEAQLRVVAVETEEMEEMEEMEEIVVAEGKTAVMEEVMEDLLEELVEVEVVEVVEVVEGTVGMEGTAETLGAAVEGTAEMAETPSLELRSPLTDTDDD